MSEITERKDPAAKMEEEQHEGSVFRRSSLERISSPEQLNDYIRVASPRVWVVLLALVVFLAGAVIWSVFGHIGSTVYGVAIVKDRQCTLYIAQEKTAYLNPGDAVQIEERRATLSSISPEPFTVTVSIPEYARSVGELSLGEWVRSATVDMLDIPDGIYPAVIEEERLSAISLLTDLQ